MTTEVQIADYIFIKQKKLRFIKNIVIMSSPQCKKVKMTSSLEQLKALTIVVADTGDFQGKFNLINTILTSSTDRKIICKSKVKVTAYRVILVGAQT